MQIKVRVRVNDVNEDRKANQLAHNGFILYDHCSEVKFGEKQTVSLLEFRNITAQWNTIYDMRKNQPYNRHPETNELIDNLIYMVRDIDATETRLTEDKAYKDKPRFNYMSEVHKSDVNSGNFALSPYHYNIIEWVDRLTSKRYRLIFDTVLWLMDDNGNNLRKVEG
jgi:hypothetical protein